MNIPVVCQAPAYRSAAGENRKVFETLGVTCLSLLGAAGSGKTTLLRAVLPRIRSELRVGVIEGDLASPHDSQQIAGLGVPVVQVLVDDRSQLTASQVRHGLSELPLDDLDLLIIENVGGLIGQMRSDLGQQLRAVTLSIPAGGLLVAKYPQLFREANIILLTKHDLLPHVPFDLDGTTALLKELNPSAEVICTDVHNRVGIDRLAGWMLGYMRAQRPRTGQKHQPFSQALTTAPAPLPT